jgi:MoxR-like ATPase
MSTADDLRTILAELGEFFVEREQTLRNVMLSLLTRQHMFLLGPVGAGKTYLLESLAARVTGANFFAVQLDQQMSKDDLFGPIDIPKFEHANVWERDTDGYLPWAHLALLDEPGKAGATTLTPLLRVMNERAFRNGKTEVALPLMTIIGGSNELLDEKLAATWDRFLIREEVGYVAEADSVRQLLRASAPQGTTRVHLSDLRYAQIAVKKVTIDTDLEDRILAIRAALFAQAMPFSDRRLRASLDLLRAAAWLQGRTAVAPEDLMVLCDVLWQRPEQRAAVRDVVLEQAGDVNRQLEEVREVVESVATEIRERGVLGEVALRAYAPDANLKLRRARESLRAMPQPDARVARAEARREAVYQLMLRECFGVESTGQPTG